MLRTICKQFKKTFIETYPKTEFKKVDIKMVISIYFNVCTGIIIVMIEKLPMDLKDYTV